MNEPRRLYLLRHAKSSWEEPHLPDHDRPLAPRGEEAVRRLARYVQQSTIEPELILCSSAVRAQQTVRGIYPDARIVTERELYIAGEDRIFDRLRRIDPAVRSVMVVGHDPALRLLVLKLAGSEAPDPPDNPYERYERPAPERLAEIREKFPTGALATITFAATWPDLRPHRGVLTGYVRPRQLE